MFCRPRPAIVVPSCALVCIESNASERSTSLMRQDAWPTVDPAIRMPSPTVQFSGKRCKSRCKELPIRGWPNHVLAESQSRCPSSAATFVSNSASFSAAGRSRGNGLMLQHARPQRNSFPNGLSGEPAPRGARPDRVSPCAPVRTRPTREPHRYKIGSPRKRRPRDRAPAPRLRSRETRWRSSRTS